MESETGEETEESDENEDEESEEEDSEDSEDEDEDEDSDDLLNEFDSETEDIDLEDSELDDLEKFNEEGSEDSMEELSEEESIDSKDIERYENASESEDGLEDSSEEESNNAMEENMMETENISASESDGENSIIEDEESDIEENIKGSEKEVAAVKEEEKSFPSGAYVPPHLRKKLLSANNGKYEEYLRLQKLLQGQLNRLGESNLEPIFRQISEIYRSNPRHDVTEILTETLLASISDSTSLQKTFVIVYSALTCLLFNTVGVDVVAHMVQKSVEAFVKQMEESTENEASHKKANNLLTFICYLYIFKVIGTNLIFDLLNGFLEKLNEFDVELILRILQVCGFELRSDDPLALKSFIQRVAEEYRKRDPNSTSARFKFMLESIQDIKNNKRKKAFEMDSSVASLLKFIRNRLKDDFGGATLKEALGIGLEDLKSAEKRGKWWLVGATWRDSSEERDESNNGKQTDLSMKGMNSSELAQLEKLARDQGMNTEVRRCIFVIVMSSNDFCEAFERLCKLNLKEKQEREIVRVIMHCCGQESCYNPFYGVLLDRFCQWKYGYRVTLQFAFWDFFKVLASGDGEAGSKTSFNPSLVRKISHLSKLLSHLISTKSLSIYLLRVVEFEKLFKQRSLVLFLQKFIAQLAGHDITAQCDNLVGTGSSRLLAEICEPLLKGTKAVGEKGTSVRQGLHYFLHQFCGAKAHGGEPWTSMWMSIEEATFKSEIDKKGWKKHSSLLKVWLQSLDINIPH